MAAIVSARRKIKKPLQNLAMWRDSSESFIPLEILLYWKPGKPGGYRDADLVLLPQHPRTNVPFSLFTVEERGDKVRAEFLKRHRLKKSPWWEEVLAIPRLLVAMELHKAFSVMRMHLERMEVPVAPRFKVYDADPDGMEEVRADMGLDDAVKDGLKAWLRTGAQLVAFSELCYASPERQRWLQQLAK